MTSEFPHSLQLFLQYLTHLSITIHVNQNVPLIPYTEQLGFALKDVPHFKIRYLKMTELPGRTVQVQGLRVLFNTKDIRYI